MGATNTLFALCIDVEPDELCPDPGAPAAWSGFEAAVRRLDGMRREMVARGRETAVTWFVRADPQIEKLHGNARWAFHRFERELERATDGGDALGLHVHSYRWLDEEATWLVDQGTPSWVEHCTASGLEAFRGATGTSCALFRFGDRWFSPAAIRQLSEAGVRFDVTLEPEQAGATSFHPLQPSTGAVPATFGAPRAPYHPDSADPLAPGTLGLWMVPLSVAAVAEKWAPVQRLPWGLLRRLHRYPLRQETLRLDAQPRAFLRQVAELRGGFLRCVTRSDAFVDPILGPVVEANLGWLARQLDFEFITIPAGMERLGLEPAAQGNPVCSPAG